MVQNNDKVSSNKLISWFIDNHVAANILMLLLLVGGIISVMGMRTETFPTIDPRLIAVSVNYPGATPYEIADSITRRVEEELVGIEGVKRIASTASEGYGVVNIELEDFIDADDVYNEVETSVNSLINFPPQDAEKPIISKVKVTPNVLTLAIYGDVDEYSLRYWADFVEDQLRNLPAVGLTTVRGVREYQISIEIDEDSLSHYGLTLGEIANKINEFGSDIPSGTVESSRGDILLRIQEKKYRGKDFANIVLKTLPSGNSLLLGDVAKIIDGFEDKNLISKFNNKAAAFIDVKRSASEDTLKIANEVKEYLKNIELPTGLSIVIGQDETVNLRDRISLMVRNGLLGFMLVFLILLLFLDLKLAFWTSAAIPISFFGGLMLMSFLGYSLNMITLFALIVVLGVVVDDGIIMGESIFNAQEKFKGQKNATAIGVQTVIAPVTVGVLTTMAAFAPLIFSTGILGQIIRVIPPVVILVLLVSLIEAYFILPSHLSSDTRWSKGIIYDIRKGFAKKLEKFVKNILEPTVKLAMRFRYATLALFLAIMIITFSMVGSGVVRFIFFPQVESDQVTIKVQMPVGTSFRDTKKTILEIEKSALEVKKEIEATSKNSPFESISVVIGELEAISAGPAAGNGSGSGNNVGQVKVQLVPSDFRNISSKEVEKMIRQKIENLPNIEKLEFLSSLIGEEADIEIELSHQDEQILNLAAKELRDEIANLGGTKEVAYSFEKGKSEFVFKLNEEGLATGLTPAEVGRQIRAAFFGFEVQRFQRDNSEIIVYVRYPKKDRENIAMLKNTKIRLANGSEVALANIADINEQQGYAKIETVNGKRIIGVTSDVDNSITTPNEVIAIIQKDILPEISNKYPSLSYSFEGESKEQSNDLASLGRNMLIALMVIYVMLGAQLRSYVQPIVIMSAIPFGVVGAILGHFFLGYDLTFISMFGVVALMGVVVNDSIVLVDYLNRKHKEGHNLFDSAILAIERRFRPILLTTFSTSLGLLPILLEKSLQAKFLVPMVVSLSMGILFATFIILILIPCLVLIVDDLKAVGINIVRKFVK